MGTTLQVLLSSAGWRTVHVEVGRKKRQFSIITNEKSKQSQCFSEYKLSMLSQHLSQVNVAGIYLSHKVVWRKSHAKTSLYRVGSSNPLSFNWASGTGTEFQRPHKFCFEILFLSLAMTVCPLSKHFYISTIALYCQRFVPIIARGITIA